jgi:NAD dependent epimerase/dehydratase family
MQVGGLGDQGLISYHSVAMLELATNEVGPMHLQRRILVTGGGFLGSHLCERLLAEGTDVLCVDNFLPALANFVRAVGCNMDCCPHYEIC